jgi:type II secretory pathway predicted ATPase ExeA
VSVSGHPAVHDRGCGTLSWTEQEISNLLGRLRDGQRELYVIGPSGSGKSSLVAAGLVPSLRRSPELAGGAFLVRQMRSGAAPAVTLAGVLEATATERSDGVMRWLEMRLADCSRASPITTGC